MPLAAGQWRPAERGAARAAAGAPQLGTGSGGRQPAGLPVTSARPRPQPALPQILRLRRHGPGKARSSGGDAEAVGSGGQSQEVGFSPSGAARRVSAVPLSATRRGAAPAQPAGRSRTEARFHGQSCAAAQNGAGLGHLLKFESTASFYTQEKCYA